VVAVADDRTGPSGRPVSLRPGDTTYTPGLVPFLRLAATDVRPGAPDHLMNPAAGVRLGGLVRRVAIAWALQVGSVLTAPAEQRVAWRLDPAERLRRVAPFAEWGAPRAQVVGQEVYWRADGFAVARRFPSSRAVEWRGRGLGLMRAGFVGLVHARTGGTQVFLRPDADAVAQAWGRAAAPLVQPAEALPGDLAGTVGLPPEQAAAQAQVLQGAAWLGQPVARYGRAPYPLRELAASGAPADPVAMPFLNEAGTAVTRLAAGPARAGALAVRVLAADSVREVGSPRELQQRWDRFPFFQQLRDSVRASGSDFRPGLIRYWARGDTLLAYQPSYAVGPGGVAALVLVNVALGPRLGAGRTWDDAWRNLRGEIGPVPVGGDIAARLGQAREWLERADAALRRGDLEEFGRAFGFLRELLRAGAGPARPDST
jgi:hypothetical protein